MSQATPTIGSGETGTSYRGLDNSGKSAANTAHKGASPPSYAEAGYTWTDDSADPLWYERKFKGGTVSDLANWPIIAEIDSSAAVTRPRIRRRILSKTAAYTATVADQGAFVLADPTSAAFTIKLPAASAALAGFAIGFRNDGTGNDLTVQRADATSDTVDGATSVAVAPGETLELVLDASTGWKIASGSGSADNKKVLVSGTDTTEGYIGAKLSGTSGVGVSTINGGSNEQVQFVLNIDGLTGESTFADDDQFAKQKASAGNRRKFTWANLKTAVAALFQAKLSYAKYSYTVSSGTSGGGGVAANAWTQLALNTEDSDPDGVGALSANRVTLAAGTYRVRGWCTFGPMLAAGVGFGIRLRNITDGTTVLVGGHSVGGSTGNIVMTTPLEGIFTVAGSKALELQYWCNSTSASLGAALTTGEVEVYRVLEFEKLA
ncbi:hypothetical protein FRZ44_37860 [Hypericibacter terrae]|uniref:Uncharacterized protein n=1 Tax=Hypericibacter terrae TaxID=2602015 RepID=A0A5J6MM89_9PROT|nr:hypothetical protein [Hypericibacter terrae]QEX18479.1 hypothetical protein FRZ44_37860 [Hypericibacter terrae]